MRTTCHVPEPLARRIELAARQLSAEEGTRAPMTGGATPGALMRWCSRNLPPRFSICFPRTGDWDQVISAATAIRALGINLPGYEARRAAMIAKAICLATSNLRSPRTRGRQRVKISSEHLDFQWVGYCRLCYRTAPIISDSARTHFCSYHSVGETSYKVAMRRRIKWQEHIDAFYKALKPEQQPWASFEVANFRTWLMSWFPLTAEKYASDNAATLVAAIDDGEVPDAARSAREAHHAQICSSSKRLVAFLADVEAWNRVEAAPRGGARARRSAGSCV